MASRTSQVSATSTIFPLVEESDTASWFLGGASLGIGNRARGIYCKVSERSLERSERGRVEDFSLDFRRGEPKER
jgi:hypothetical protein